MPNPELKVTVLPDAGRDEMVHRMIHGTNLRTGKPNAADRLRLGRKIARHRAAPVRRIRARRRRLYITGAR